MGSGQNFGSDVLVEILSRSSLETVRRSRLLSKEYNLLSYESAFMNLHRERTKTIYGYFLQLTSVRKDSSVFVSPNNSSSQFMPISLDFLPRPMQIEAASNNGLLFLIDRDDRSGYISGRVFRSCYVCKPTTEQWQQIPNPKTRYWTELTGLIVLRSKNPLHYKIVRFSTPKYRKSKDFYQRHLLRFEVFDSQTWAWKQLGEVRLLDDKEERFVHRPAVTVSGSLHWLTSKNRILAFHANTETCSLILLPQPVCEDMNRYRIKLVEYEGKLSLIRAGREENYMELWVRENCAINVWNKRKIVNIEAFGKFPEGFWNTDVVLMAGDEDVTFFNFKDGSSSTISLRTYFRKDGIFPFQSDFEPVALEHSRGSFSPMIFCSSLLLLVAYTYFCSFVLF